MAVKGLQVYNSNIVVSDKKAERLEIRSQIEEFKTALQDITGSERGDADAINEAGLSEYITGGAYTRVLKVAKDTALVSELWKKQRLWIIVKGRVIVTTEEGQVELVAPYIGVAPFGTKASILTVEDTVWIAVTGVESETEKEIKEELIATDYSDISYEWDLIEENKL